MRRLVLVLLTLVLVAPVTPAAAAPPTADQQLDWVLEVSHRVPVAEPELRAHLAGDLLDGVGGPSGFNELLTSLGPLTRTGTIERTPTRAQAVADERVVVDVHTGDGGLVTGLWFRPYAPSPDSWSELDSRLLALAPRVSYAASVVDPLARNGCRPVHQVGADTPRPLGSAIKLYVLGALERATTDWDQVLPIRDAWKSLPTGVLQDRPAGTPVTLREHADLMISISDNTATDHLIHHLGRAEVGRQLHLFGNSAPRLNQPLLTTRELFALKGFRYPTLAGTYLALPRALRHTVLPAVAAVPRNAIEWWTEPRDLDSIEWFGSANDMCRALAGLWRLNSPRVAGAMSIADGGIGLDRTEYPTVWFKGGSEPGLLVLNHLARTADGRVAVASIMLSNPNGAIDPNATTEALALVRGGLEMATA
jgi:hypothetical protein